jgi:hypothetical protein
MSKFEVGSPHVFKVIVETEDFELSACHAKMCKSLKNLAAYHLLNKTPTFFHLSKNGQIHMVFPTALKRKE